MKSKTMIMCDGWKLRFTLTKKGILIIEKSFKPDPGYSQVIDIFDSCKHKPLTELRKFLNKNKIKG